jgi:hypothetical protein
MVPEAPLEQTEHGLAAAGEGWFVLNARAARWRHSEERRASLRFEGETDFAQLGITLVVLWPGEPMTWSVKPYERAMSAKALSA